MGYNINTGTQVTVNPDIDIKSSDNSVDVSSALENDKKTYDLKVEKTAVTSSDESVEVTETTTAGVKTYDLKVQRAISGSMSRITLSQSDITAGEKTLDFDNTDGFIIETYNDSPIPDDFVFVASGTIDQEKIYQFNFPTGAKCLYLEDSNDVALINSITDYPNGIYAGEVVNATPETDTLWSLEKDSSLTSQNGSITINPNTPKGFDLSVTEVYPVAYAKDAKTFNSGVSYLKSKGGGKLLITGDIVFQDFADTTKIPAADRQFTIETWTCRNTGETPASNADSVINFGSNLDSIYIEKYKPSGAFILRKESNSKLYTLKAHNINVKGIQFRGTRSSHSYSNTTFSSQPYCIIRKSISAENCAFRLQSGMDNASAITSPLKELVWTDNDFDEDGTNGNFPSVYLLNPDFSVSYYVSGDPLFTMQSSIIIRHCGYSTSCQLSRLSTRICYRTDEERVLPASNDVKIIDDRSVTENVTSTKGSFLVTAPGSVITVVNGDNLASGYSANRESVLNSLWAANKLKLYDTETLSNPEYMLTLDSDGLVKKSTVPTGGGVSPSDTENQILRTVLNQQTQELETAWDDEMLSGFETYSYIDAQESGIPHANDTVSAMLVRCNPLADSVINDLSVLIVQGAQRVFRLAIYDNNLNLLGQTAETTLNQTGYVTLDLPVPVKVSHSESYLIGILASGNGYLLSGRTINLQTNNIRPFVYQSGNGITNNTFPDAFNNEVKTGSTFVPYLAANSGV